MPAIDISNTVSNDFEMQEAFRVLRTNILFSGKDVKSIAFTSCHANEGKTDVSFNLALSLAQSGKKVVFLDADMRKSVLYGRLVQTKNTHEEIVGLSNYLSGMNSARDVLYSTNVKGMFIIFAGPLVRNSAELLGSAETGHLIKSLKESFDYVIIDTPPLGQVIDCATMAFSIDRAVMVVDVNDNNYKMNKRVQKQLEASGCKILGVVLNKVNFKERNGYYGKYYYRKKYGRYYY